MLEVPFLTAIDRRAEVKGSRDPLGLQPIWTRFGRQVIGNLTTVSTSVRDFTVLLLGYYFAERVAEADREASTVASFLKWEQLAGYARATVNGDTSFRGTERVQLALAEGGPVIISIAPTHQILGDQKNYGLWGLYTVPARSSGLVDGDPPQVSAAARVLVEEEYLPRLGGTGSRNRDRITELLSAESTKLDPRGRDRKLLEAIAGLLKWEFSSRERTFYWRYLAEGGDLDDTGGRQRQLAGLLAAVFKGQAFQWSPALVNDLVKRARAAEWSALADRLDQIRTCESVLAPANDLVMYLLGCSGRSVDEVLKRVSGAWNPGLRTIDLDAINGIRSQLANGDEEAGDRWVRIADAMRAGNWSALLELILDQNRAVMAARGGSPWLAKKGALLDVRFRDENGQLPRRSELAGLWRNPYFLDSLRVVVSALGGRRA